MQPTSDSWIKWPALPITGRLWNYLGPAIRSWVNIFVFVGLVAVAERTQAQWTDSFESPESSWWQLSKSPHHQLRKAQRVFRDAKDGAGFEKLSVTQRGKTPIQLAHRVDPMRVIDELAIRLWVKSSRTGTLLGARVTLPNTIDAKTGDRLSVILLGQETTEIGRWTMLKLDELPTVLESQLPTLRKTRQHKIDPSGAYVDLVVVQDAAGPGENQICVDGLIIDGVAFANEQPKKHHSKSSSLKGEGIGRTAATLKAPPQVRVAAGILEIDESPAFVRSIESSGESLEFLKSLGFNAVELREPPTLAQDQEAARLGLWLITPPAFDPRTSQKQRAFQSVIAWTLGDGVGESELETARKYIAEFRSRDSDATPLFVAGATSHQWEWSRLVDLLIADPGSLMGQYELADQGRRLKSIRSRGKPGIPCWAVVHTEPASALVAQWDCFLPVGGERIGIGPEQIRLQALQAILGGARGLKFQSKTRLDGKNSIDELRATTLKWLNLQLDVLAPWAASGDASILAGSNSEMLFGSVATDRATLFVLANQSPDAQFETTGTFSKTTKISLGGEYERTPRFQLNWRGVRQLNTPPTRGDGKIEIERTGNVDYLIVADDATAIGFAKGILEQKRSEVAATQVQMTSLWLQQSQLSLQRPQAEFAPAEAKLVEASRNLTSGDEYQALRNSEEAVRLISRVRKAVWAEMAAPLPSPLISPLCVCAELSSAHGELSRRIGHLPWSRNQLPAGELESIESLQASGWLAYQTADSAYSTEINNCDREPHGGRGAVSLVTRTSGRDHDLDQVTAAVTTAGVPVHRGDLVRYRVWARSNKDSPAGANYIQMFDNLGGRSLGFSQQTSEVWTPVIFYRFAPADGDAALTIALVGAGAVDIDSLEIQSLSQEQISGDSATKK